ncbi:MULTISPECIES: sulfotransferase family 2 domain-containing protein [unclassified Ruegeria]|uniref:sulfotransferase family 2 domain-containing protein n=1 Tax=unclassified Ruegeria TaxID=2625375 RepID=UPI001490955C|nr:MULTISPECIES: sulfotransferase family 2 domain-containing protein [unclassified Ruegeria]NOD36585.1 sulfotransferase family 2 domain-containing protein [Ruegeria sp. HKCCD7296]NOE43825.1 sulfotransferase family 2 domain-containing protein [Ruegeria sp. HKCCD7319]
MISHEHKAIFVHIPKTAGQSIEQVFVDELGLSWENRDDLNLRYNDDPTFGPQQLSHLYADEYVKLGHISQRQWDEYFKFSIVRNPYDRILSEFRYRDVKTTGPLFWFLRKKYSNDYSDLARHVVSQTRYLFDQNGKCLVDEIIKFEDLNERMPEIFTQIFGQSRALPKRNESPAGKRRFTRDQLSGWNRRAIQRRFREDFKAFGYDPEG